MVPKTLSWKELGEQIGVDFSSIDEMGDSVEEQRERFGWSQERIDNIKARRGSGLDNFAGLPPDKQIDSRL